ncbi:MAG TPA: DUF3489 domain-containing protein [Rhizomicrobium sp.]|jgi:hypothetical protein|nr:DUF3489 domain-containing protein [Rhizomicrobium sp.]
MEDTMIKSAKTPRAWRAAKTSIEPAIGALPRKNRRPRAEEATARKRAGKPKLRAAAAPPGSKLSILETLLRRPAGMTIAHACQATGWQAHSVRGAIAGALKKRGLRIVSEKADSIRTYHVAGLAP